MEKVADVTTEREEGPAEGAPAGLPGANPGPKEFPVRVTGPFPPSPADPSLANRSAVVAAGTQPHTNDPG